MTTTLVPNEVETEKKTCHTQQLCFIAEWISVFQQIGLVNDSIMGVGSKINVGGSSPQKKQLLEYMPFSVVWGLLINGIGRLIGRCIYITSAH